MKIKERVKNKIGKEEVAKFVAHMNVTNINVKKTENISI